MNFHYNESKIKTEGSVEDPINRFMEAAKIGNAQGLKAMLRDRGSNPLAKDSTGWSALMWAAQNEHEACVRLLLTASGSVVKGMPGMTELMLAAIGGHESSVKLLLPRSDPRAKDRGGRTASTWARSEGYESLAQFIDAYVLAQSERESIGATTSPGVPGGVSSIRI